MTIIPCTGDFYVCEPVYDGDKVVDITIVPIIAWQIEDGMYHPIAADTLFDDDVENFVIYHGCCYYQYGSRQMHDRDEVIAHFQHTHDHLLAVHRAKKHAKP